MCFLVYNAIFTTSKKKSNDNCMSFIFLPQSLPNSLLADSLRLPTYSSPSSLTHSPHSLFHLSFSRALPPLRTLTRVTQFSAVSQPLAFEAVKDNHVFILLQYLCYAICFGYHQATYLNYLLLYWPMFTFLAYVYVWLFNGQNLYFIRK
jgi:hypothetical protein